MRLKKQSKPLMITKTFRLPPNWDKWIGTAIRRIKQLFR